MAMMLFAVALAASPPAHAAPVSPAAQWVQTLGIKQDSAALRAMVAQQRDSMLSLSAFGDAARVQYAIHPRMAPTQRTADFYLLLLLALLLGFIRFYNSRYFANLLRAFRAASDVSRDLREQIQHAVLPNLGMNVFFSCVLGAYLYYVLRMVAPRGIAGYNAAAALLVLSAGALLLYAGKWAIVRFSGWAFRLERITGQYLFNIFLVNKVLGILLLPFVALMALGDPRWVMPLMYLSFAVVGLMFLNRYLRSWQTFGSFFQYSRFHFFIYLCASEILPLACIVKIVTRLL